MNRWLAAAAVGSGAVALLHVVVIAAGPDAYGYFGAPELGAREAAGSSLPDLVTAGLVLVFATWAYYALAGAGFVSRRPPLLASALVAIGAIYTLRGALLIPEILTLLRGHPYPARHLIFSAVSLVIGVCYLLGAITRRAASAPDRTPRAPG